MWPDHKYGPVPMRNHLRLTSLLVGAAFTVAATAHADDAPAPAPAVVSAPAGTTAKASDDDPRPSFAVGVGVGAGGAVFLVAGIVLGALAKSRSNQQEGNVGNPPLYTPSLTSRAAQGQTMADVGYGFIAVGSAALIADVVLWAEKYRPAKKKKVDQAAIDGTRLVGTYPKPTVTPGIMSLRVTF
jgi:hypothetical protein